MDRTHAIKFSLLIFFLSFIIYSNSLGGEFLYDDEYFIVKNIAIRNIGNIPRFFVMKQTTAFADLANDVYRPFTVVSYAVDYLFWRLDTFGYHLVNVLIHSASGILLFLLLYIAFGNIFLSLLAAIFFVSHPVQTEVVSWISGRSSALFLFFYLSAFLFYIRAFREKKRHYYVISILLFILSLFSKEMAITLPFMLAAYDLHFTKNKISWPRRIAGYVPYLLIAVLFIMIKAFVVGRVSQCGWWGDSPYYTFLTMSRMLVVYMRLLLAPVNLCAMYVIDISRSFAEGRVMGSIALISAIFISLFFVFRRYRIISFGIFWFFITLLPVSNIVPLRALIAERFLYLPSVGYCIILAALMTGAWQLKAGRYSNLLKYLSVAAALFVTLSYSIATMRRNEDWKNPISISDSIIKVSPLNPWGYTSLGSAYIGKESYEEAIKPLKKAIRLSPAYASPWNALGFSYLQLGRYEESIGALRRSLELKGDSVETLNSLGVAYANVDNFGEAIKNLEQAIRLDPSFVSAYLNLGAVYERKNDYDRAIGLYEEALRKTNSLSDNAIAYIRMGDVYKKMKDVRKAAECYDKAIELAVGSNFEELRKVAEERRASLN